MKLPLIKHISKFISENDEDYIVETIESLEHLTEFEGLKENEIDVIGELISNLYGAMEVQKLIQQGQSQKEALNGFMQRVQSAID